MSNLIRKVKKTKNFELAFANIYPNFTKELLNISDEFTSVEIKICMLLKMNYSSDLIKRNLKISNSTFLNSRSSIRKKLGLERNQKLINTIIKI